ncbi:MAG TPA: chemotaxis protein, partial [Chromatiales bacterium]|nr:chemotaxis protein [Chromatiales bacterium]
QETAQHLQTQQAETEQVATAMNEMTATVAEVARNTEQAAGAAHQAMNEVDSGSATVDAVRNAINRLASEVETSAHSVQELADKSQNISNILEVIRGIAEQTNLLALNAAIEAARAGEQGRGFAVVADEVRSLAKRTQDATVEIKEVIDELQGGIGDVVAVMERGREQAEIAVTQAGEADASLQTIREAVHHINEMNAQIATAATEQEAVAEEMNRNIVTISQMTAEVAEDADQNAHASADLATVLGQLQEQLSVFHIKTSSHFDFEKAKAAHLAWKGRLRNYLDGDRSALTKEQAVSHRHCVLGKWYYGEGMQQYGDLPEFKDIEPPHAELHKIIKEILNLKEAGRDDEAEELYKQVEPISKRIVSLLDEVERKATAA